jgi:hypothetical protein
MDVTLLGMVELQHPAIKVFDDLSIIALQLSRESYIVFPLSTVIDDGPIQPAKAPLGMDVTLLGMVKESTTHL